MERRRRDEHNERGATVRDKTKEERDMEECTFHPKISRRTEEIARSRGTGQAWRGLHRDPGQQTARLRQLADEVCCTVIYIQHL
jgi:hypothetical protein